MDGKSNGKLCGPCEEDVEAKHCMVDSNLDQESDCPNVDGVQSILSVEEEVKRDEMPSVGLEFESEDDAYVFYNRYARVVGFSVRKDFLNKSKVNGVVVSRRFTCFKEGFRRKDKRDINVKKPRKQTRTGCLAQMTISRQPNGNYHVIHFEANHNHDVISPHLVHMLPSQRRLAFAQAVEADLRVQEDLKLASSSRYKEICLRAIKISTRATESGEAFQFAVEKFDVVMQEVEKILNIKRPEETQVFALIRHGANDSGSDCVVEGVDSDENQPNAFTGSMKGGEDVQDSTPNTFSSIQCRPSECFPLQFPTLVTQGFHSFGTNPFIGYTCQPPNVAACQQSNLSMYQHSNFFISQTGFPSHIHVPLAMDTEDQHPQPT